ncbi:hypothetical protein BKA58DRAFT_395667, partial [Alternaria rosae]|uniref:uncharacterized protein n=1 Tax=Alternaria rosae TaxID=1187941 RepID=UPI001E8D826F
MEHIVHHPHSRWQKFTYRQEKRHRPEDDLRLCNPGQTSSQVIERFLSPERDKIHLDQVVPRQRQILRDFLREVIPAASRRIYPYLQDVERYSSDDSIALLDDRQNHEGCEKISGKPCNDCVIFSRSVCIPELCARLQEKRRTFKAEKRIIFIPNLTSAAAVCLAATVAERSAVTLRDFLHRYLKREVVFSATTTWGFFFEFHIPYHAMRRGPLTVTEDPRLIGDKRLRKTEPLPLGHHPSDQEDLYYHEALTSSLSWGADEWFWTELCLVDTYFGSEEKHKSYFTGCQEGDGLDPPCGGRIHMTAPRFDPREYFLLKLKFRTEQVVTEYSTLIETFNKRMDEYAQTIRRVFEDDNKRTNTRTISDVIETTQLSLFTSYIPERSLWPNYINSIMRNVAELDRLRKTLLTKRDRFKFKLDS